MAKSRHREIIQLPEPHYDSEASIEKALLKRRSVRSFRDEPLTLKETSQLLWSAQGVTNRRSLRTAPSAGALYPLEVYMVAGNVGELSSGIYKYHPHSHELSKCEDGDKRQELFSFALRQGSVRAAPLVLVFAAVYERMTSKYGQRGIRYVHIEIGHAAQNVSLQAISLGLGTVMIGAFEDRGVKAVMSLDADEDPLYIIPIGR